jgi:hypothetical protein
MSQIVDDLRQVAIEIKTETQVGGNTAARVGGAFERVADALEGTQQIEDMDAAVAAVQQAAAENEQTIQDIVNSLAVVQETGQSTSAVMSQKAVTDELNTLSENLQDVDDKYSSLELGEIRGILLPSTIIEGRRPTLTNWLSDNNVRAYAVPYTYKEGTKQQTVAVPSEYTKVSGRDMLNGPVTFQLVKENMNFYNAQGYVSKYNIFVAPVYDGLSVDSFINITISK